VAQGSERIEMTNYTDRPAGEEQPMTDKELRGRLADIQGKLSEVKSAASDKGHFLILIILFILLMRSCKP